MPSGFSVWFVGIKYGSLFSKQSLFSHRTGIFRIGSQRELKFGIIHTIEVLINVRYIMIQISICIIISFTQTFSDLETMFPVSDKKKSTPQQKTKKTTNFQKWFFINLANNALMCRATLKQRTLIYDRIRLFRNEMIFLRF